MKLVKSELKKNKGKSFKQVLSIASRKYKKPAAKRKPVRKRKGGTISKFKPGLAGVGKVAAAARRRVKKPLRNISFAQAYSRLKTQGALSVTRRKIRPPLSVKRRKAGALTRKRPVKRTRKGGGWKTKLGIATGIGVAALGASAYKLKGLGSSGLGRSLAGIRGRKYAR